MQLQHEAPTAHIKQLKPKKESKIELMSTDFIHVNAKAIRQGLHSSKCPARPTVALSHKQHRW